MGRDTPRGDQALSGARAVRVYHARPLPETLSLLGRVPARCGSLGSAQCGSRRIVRPTSAKLITRDRIPSLTHSELSKGEVQPRRSRRTSGATFGSGVFGCCEALLWRASDAPLRTSSVCRSQCYGCTSNSGQVCSLRCPAFRSPGGASRLSGPTRCGEVRCSSKPEVGRRLAAQT